jgi:hypothetical protein
MAVIKSTLDLVLEKTKHLTLSDEEKQKQRYDKLRKKLKGLVQRFTDRVLKLEELKKEWEVLQQAYELNGKNVLILEISEKINLDRDNAALLQLLQEFRGKKAPNINSLLKNYQDTRRSMAEKKIHKIKEDLAQNRFISGSAIVPNLEADPEWQAEVQDIKHKFDTLLCREKAKLIES